MSNVNLDLTKEQLEQLRSQLVLTPDEKKMLSDIYGRLWTEANYDPFNEATKAFAKPLSDLMSELNETLRFKL